jgi:hypothetical protein
VPKDQLGERGVECEVLFAARHPQQRIDGNLQRRHSRAHDKQRPDGDVVGGQESAKLKAPMVPARKAAIITGFSAKRSTQKPAGIDITP